MSFLSTLDSVISYIGFMVGAPSISSPLDAPLQGSRSQFERCEAARQITIQEDATWPEKPQHYHFDDLHAGLGMETAGCSDDPAPGSGQLDSFGGDA